MLKEFRDFAIRGNVIDLAIGVILGVAFGAIINSLVVDVIMPPVGLLLGSVDFSDLFLVLQEGSLPGPYPSVTMAKEVGAVTVNYGLFVNTLVNFLIVSIAMFVLVRAVNRAFAAEEKADVAPDTKDCPFCFSSISMKAIRCPFCTSNL